MQFSLSPPPPAGDGAQFQAWTKEWNETNSEATRNRLVLALIEYSKGFEAWKKIGGERDVLKKLREEYIEASKRLRTAANQLQKLEDEEVTDSAKFQRASEWYEDAKRQFDEINKTCQDANSQLSLATSKVDKAKEKVEALLGLVATPGQKVVR